jgi:hypothetical protein
VIERLVRRSIRSRDVHYAILDGVGIYMPTIQSRQTKRQNHLQKKKGRSKSTKKKSGGEEKCPHSAVDPRGRKSGPEAQEAIQQTVRPRPLPLRAGFCASGSARKWEGDFHPHGAAAAAAAVVWEVLRRTLSSTLNSSGDCAATTTTTTTTRTPPIRTGTRQTKPTALLMRARD